MAHYIYIRYIISKWHKQYFMRKLYTRRLHIPYCKAFRILSRTLRHTHKILACQRFGYGRLAEFINKTKIKKTKNKFWSDKIFFFKINHKYKPSYSQLYMLLNCSSNVCMCVYVFVSTWYMSVFVCDIIIYIIIAVDDMVSMFFITSIHLRTLVSISSHAEKRLLSLSVHRCLAFNRARHVPNNFHLISFTNEFSKHARKVY